MRPKGLAGFPTMATIPRQLWIGQHRASGGGELHPSRRTLGCHMIDQEQTSNLLTSGCT